MLSGDEYSVICTCFRMPGSAYNLQKEIFSKEERWSYQLTAKMAGYRCKCSSCDLEICSVAFQKACAMRQSMAVVSMENACF